MHSRRNHRPNILYIQADQHRYDCIGYYGSYPVKTPHLDRLAAEGTRFDHAYTPIPVCSPARQALLQGRRPESFGSLWNFDNGLPMSAMPDDAYSWPRQLQESGYRNSFFGKWGVSPDHGPDRFGFEQVCLNGDYAKLVAEKYGPIPYKNGFFGEPSPIPVEDSLEHYMARKCIDAILEAAQTDQPWHIRLDFIAPHLPCRPSEPFASMYDPKDIPEWPSFQDTFENKPYIQRQQLVNWGIEEMTWADWAPTVALYYGYISQLDDAIGQVLQKLDDLDLAEDTIVVYTADHGDLCGGHRMMDKHYIMYDEVVRVPMLMRWPGHIAADQICDDFVCNLLDLPPTLLEAAGEDVPNFFHGQSLWPLLNGDAEGWREAAVTTYNGQQFGLFVQRMWRTKDWKYVWNPTDIDELYDMQEDPHELVNLIHQPKLQEMIADFRKQLYAELCRVEDKAVAGEWMKRQLTESRKL